MELRYGMRLRGFSPGCQPMNGLIRREDSYGLVRMEGHSQYFHDILVYNRKLSDKEIRDYELTPLYVIGGSYGEKIDSLRERYPFKIIRENEPDYAAVLRGVQPLLEGQEMPIYRFPGGECCVDLDDNGIMVLEW